MEKFYSNTFTVNAENSLNNFLCFEYLQHDTYVHTCSSPAQLVVRSLYMDHAVVDNCWLLLCFQPCIVNLHMYLVIYVSMKRQLYIVNSQTEISCLCYLANCGCMIIQSIHGVIGVCCWIFAVMMHCHTYVHRQLKHG